MRLMMNPLAAQIKTVHEESKGRYGAPRVREQLPAGSNSTGASESPGSCTPAACKAGQPGGGVRPPSPTRPLPG